MKKLHFYFIGLFAILIIAGLFLASPFYSLSKINLDKVEITENQKLALNFQDKVYNDYLQNADKHLERYNAFSQESSQITEKLDQSKAVAKEEIPFEFDDLMRNPKDYDVVSFTQNDISKTVLSQANIGTLASKIDNQSLPARIGFNNSSIANNSSNINVYQEFNVTFATAPTTEQLNALQFYPVVNFSKTVSGNTVTIRPMKMKRNTNYTFGISLGYGICGQNNCSTKSINWTHGISFKTEIKEAILIGFTIQGNPMFAFAYGNADENGKSILLTGATHGEEWHAGGLWKWLGWMDANRNEFATQNKEMIIVTEINIDGANRQRATRRFNNSARYNSRGVNLNRNFPNGWQGCSICGSGPASEPETQAIINLSLAENVTHMIAYHNQWPPVGIIFLGSNGNPATVAWAQWTGSRTGYPVGIYNGPEIITSSSGSVPGDQVVWAESVGIRGLLIEGSYRGVDDYAKNFPMYLALVREF